MLPQLQYQKCMLVRMLLLLKRLLKDGDDYVINGSKMWITNSLQADFFCLLANTSDDKPHVNKSMIIVPAKLKGLVFQNR